MTDRRSGKAIFRELGKLVTEQRNPRSKNLDRLSTAQILKLMNQEDRRVPLAVGREIKHITRAVDMIVERLQRGGRLFYVGAGTSGRLGVLDATECPPTFGTPRTLVQGIIAGGRKALVRSVEGSEDDSKTSQAALRKHRVGKNDVVVGIMASRRTPYALGALEYGRRVGAATIAVTANPSRSAPLRCDVVIAPRVGPEVLTGSTRLKAGTAQKIALNLFSTLAMVRLGRVYRGLMVDVRASNEKLRRRSVQMVARIAGCAEDAAAAALGAGGGDVRLAALIARGLERSAAEASLKKHDGDLRAALAELG